jgi:hypothetical protein
VPNAAASANPAISKLVSNPPWREATGTGSSTNPEGNSPMAQDRAAVVSNDIIALIFQRPTPRDLRLQIETRLRDEFADVARQARNDLPPTD